MEHAEPRDIHARLSAQFADAAYILRSVQRWYQYIRQGRELLDHESQSAKLLIDFLHIQILSSLEKQPFHPAYSLAKIFDVSHTTILNHVRDSLGMKLFHLRWIPNQLTEQLRASRIQKCQELLPLLERMEANEFGNIITGDESCFMFEYQHAVKWSLCREDVSERVRQQIGTKKFMLTVIWGVDGFHVVDLMTSQRTFNSEYFVSHVLAPMVAKVFSRGKIPHTRRLQFHLDNCRVHFSKVTEPFVAGNHIGYVPHPPYSPDLALSYFWLFGDVKTSLVDQIFDEPEQLLEAITEFLNEIQPPEVVAVFSNWVERVR
jgi:hypothetical protein